jgi:hypothetical protein
MANRNFPYAFLTCCSGQTPLADPRNTMKTTESRLIAAHSALLKERETILQRIAAINDAIGVTENRASQPNPRRTHSARPLRAAMQTEPPLIRVVLEVTRKAPLSIDVILKQLKAANHPFESENPLEELTKALTSSDAIKDYGGKFGPSFKKSK